MTQPVENWMQFQMRIIRKEVEMLEKCRRAIDRMHKRERKKWLEAGGKPYEPVEGDPLD